MKIKNITFIAVAALIALFVSEGICQGAPVELLGLYGGDGSDAGSSLQQTSDGGYIFSGTTDSFGAGETDLWLVKTDVNGVEEWSRTFGGEYADMGKGIRQTDDGGYIVTGATRSYGAGKRDVWLIKTDALGNEEWSRTFGGPEWDYGRSVEQTSDGGYIVAGYTDSFGAGFYDVLLIKTDSEGYLEWEATFGGSIFDYSYSVQQTRDGGYILTCETNSFGSGDYDIWVIKTDSEGNMEWESLFGGSGVDRGRYGIQTADGGYIFTGFTTSYGAGSEDAVLIKTDADGKMLWSRTYGGSDVDRGRIVMESPAGGFIFGGYTASFGSGFDDMWVVGTDSVGNRQWSWTYGENYYKDRISALAQTNDRGLAVLGQSRLIGTHDYDIMLIKLKKSQ